MFFSDEIENEIEEINHYASPSKIIHIKKSTTYKFISKTKIGLKKPLKKKSFQGKTHSIEFLQTNFQNMNINDDKKIVEKFGLGQNTCDDIFKLNMDTINNEKDDEEENTNSLMIKNIKIYNY